MDEVKPCPFCGAKPIIRQWPVSNKPYIACVNRKCKMHPSTALSGWESINQHIRAWNRRADHE